MKTLREDICKLSGERYIIEDFDDSFVSEDENLDESAIGVAVIGTGLVVAAKAIKKRIEENKRYKWIWESKKVESQKAIDEMEKTVPDSRGFVTVLKTFNSNPGMGISIGVTTDFCKDFIDNDNHLLDFDGFRDKFEMSLMRRLSKLKEAFYSDDATKKLWDQVDKVVVQVPIYLFDLYDNEVKQLKKMIARVVKSALKDSRVKKIKVNVMNNWRAKLKGTNSYVKAEWGKH